jgi:hypothetical protein
MTDRSSGQSVVRSWRNIRLPVPQVLRAVVSVLLMAVVLLRGSAARADDHVIAPGQGSFIRDMVGGGDVLPGGCRVDRVTVGRYRIDATYGCADGVRATLWLRHVESTGSADALAGRFALGVRGEAPAGLVDAVAARVTAREAGFAWREFHAPPMADRDGRSPLNWLLVGVTLLMLVVGITRSRPAPTDLAYAGGLFAVALALRLLLGAYGPFHHNGQGGLWLQGAIGEPSVLSSFGPGYSELFRPLARLFPGAPDTAIFVANAVFSALAPALAYALGRMAGAAPLSALVVASLLAGDPVALRMAATESYLPSIIALTLAVGVLVAAAARLEEDRQRVTAALLLAAACMIGAQVIRIHPTAWIPVALAPLAASALGTPMPWRRRVGYAAAAGALVGTTILVVSGTVVRGVFDALSSGVIMRPNGSGTSMVVPLVVLGLVAALLAFTPARWLALIALPHLVVCLYTRDNFDISPIWQQAMDRLFVTVPLMTLALVLPRREAPLVFGAVAIALLGGLSTVRARTTEHYESRWLREALRAVPPECQILYLGRADDTTLFLPVFPPHGNMSTSNQGIGDTRRNAAGDDCAYYVHDSLCSTPEGRPPCEALERQLGVTQGRPVSLPAIPGHVNQSYLTPRVTVWMTRLSPTTHP